MPLDPFSATPDDRQQALLDLVADVFLEHGQWPRWPWVHEMLERRGIDALATVRSMPAEPLYAYGFLSRLGPGGPSPSHEIRLRIAGLRHVDKASVRINYFVNLIRVLGELRESILLDPFAEAEPSVTKSEMSSALGLSTPPDQVIFSMMTLEPGTWSCQVYGDTNAEWSLSLPPEIRRFAGVRDVDDYLARTQLLIAGASEVKRPRFPVSPFSLPAALDFLDVVWELKFGDPLLGRPGLERSARLAFTAMTGEEANSALSALSEVIKTMRVPGVSGVGGGPLERIEPFLSTILPEESLDRVRSSVIILRAAQTIRHNQQHSGSEASRVVSYEELGLPYPVSDWEDAWSQVQSAVASAVDALREEIQASSD